jgi:hypothetical protein
MSGGERVMRTSGSQTDPVAVVCLLLAVIAITIGTLEETQENRPDRI